MHRTQGEDYIEIDGKRMYQAADPATSTKATRLPASSMNAIQEEIAGTIEGAGLTLAATATDDETAGYGQLIQAVRALRDENGGTWKTFKPTSGTLDFGTWKQNALVLMPAFYDLVGFSGGKLENSMMMLVPRWKDAGTATEFHFTHSFPNFLDVDITVPAGNILFVTFNEHGAVQEYVLIPMSDADLTIAAFKTLSVSGGASISNGLTVNGDILLNGLLRAQSGIDTDGLYESTAGHGVTINHQLHAMNGADITGNCSISGDCNISTGCSIDGELIGHGGIICDDTVSCIGLWNDGPATNNGDVTNNEASVFNGYAAFNSSIDLNCPAVFKHSVTTDYAVKLSSPSAGDIAALANKAASVGFFATTLSTVDLTGISVEPGRLYPIINNGASSCTISYLLDGSTRTKTVASKECAIFVSFNGSLYPVA